MRELSGCRTCRFLTQRHRDTEAQRVGVRVDFNAEAQRRRGRRDELDGVGVCEALDNKL